MARAALNWSMKKLAQAAFVGEATIARFERGEAVPIAATLAAIELALEAAGVEFTNGGDPGVKLRRVE